MLNENAKKWVEALRSGDYEQTTGVLRKASNQRCCLGVACDLYAKETGEGEWVYRIGHTYFVTKRDQSYSLLPNDVRNWLGLFTSKGRFIDEHEFFSLTDLNDAGASFIKIANTIESEPEGLFFTS